MSGISSSGKENINKTIDKMFDIIALSLLGYIPRLRDKKFLITGGILGLAHLFIQAMRNKQLNAVEQDVLRGLLTTADGYVESLRAKTGSNVTSRVDALVREAAANGTKVDGSAVATAVKEEMSKARTGLVTIVEAESTKIRNIGALMDITREAASFGDNDPTVFFVVIKDGSTCKECVRLHMDGSKPKLWKFSQLKQGYHKRGEDQPSAFGLHPHCRCSLTYLSPGYGFDSSGKMVYIDQDYDAHSEQTKK